MTVQKTNAGGSSKYAEMTVSPEKGVRDRFMIGLQRTLDIKEGHFFRGFCKKGLKKFMETGQIPPYWMEELKKKSGFQNFLDGYL